MMMRLSRLPGSACVSRAGDGVPAIANFRWAGDLVLTRFFLFTSFEKFVAVGHRNQHAERVRYPGKIPVVP